jgi:oxygen-independent coproporphyrinogen-3 oxidase
MDGATINHRRLPMRAAYVHVPFCRRRCGYCNFTVVAGRDDLIEDYLRALERELSDLETPRPVATLYLGGGTPTHLPPRQLERLLRLVTHWFVLSPAGEFSVEANPIDVELTKVRILVDHGVNRLSLGVQSFDAQKLRLLERDHRAPAIYRAVDVAGRSIANLAADLIFAVPGESRSVWQHDLAEAQRLPLLHLSTYGLTFEKGARFWSLRERRELQPVTVELERWMYETAIDRLTAAGWEHYEVSNFARPGACSRHNEVYWTGGEYYAAGPGAARYLEGRREINHRSTWTYVRRVLAGQSPVAEAEQLDPENRARERLVFALRRIEGIDLARFQQETGFAATQLLGESLDRYRQFGLLDYGANHLRLTRAGLLVSDSLWPEVLRV